MVATLKKQTDEVATRGEKLSAIVFKASGLDDQEQISRRTAHSKSLPEDPFEAIQEQILEPPYDPRRLIVLSEWSTSLSSSVDTLEVNIPGFGHTLINTFPTEPPAEFIDEVEIERLRVENNLTALPRRKSLTKWRREIWRDRVLTGNGYTEVIRSPLAKEAWVGVKRLKSYRMRLLRQDPEMTEYKIKIPQMKRDGTIQYIELTDARRFRRYVEAVSNAPFTSPTSSEIQYRFFKEYGDPRVIDNKTGEVVNEKEQKNFEGSGKPMPESRKASEVYHWGDSDRSPYGIPRWISAMASVLGARSGELVNLHTLENNGIPSMVVAVSNGRLTDDTIERIKQYVDNHVKGNANYSTFLVMEGEDDNEGDESNHVKINITPLADTQVRDMLFGDYIDSNEQRTTQAFRLAPIYQGRVGQYNKATAEISRRLTEEQVFAPERNEDDWWFNHVLFPEWEVKYHKFVTNTPNITDNKDLIAMSTSLERVGAMTPRLGREVAKEVYPKLAQKLGFKKPLEGEEEKFDPDVPFSLTIAERVKNQGLANEVNQQVAPVMPPMEAPADPTQIKAAFKYLIKHLDELEEAAEAEFNRYVEMARLEAEE